MLSIVANFIGSSVEEEDIQYVVHRTSQTHMGRDSRIAQKYVALADERVRHNFRELECDSDHHTGH